ncbi:MAG TPA: M28 family peptidase [Gaiellaceae bacterium]|nr:M28 family peptidase [Gaiellaceae bacterium]
MRLRPLAVAALVLALVLVPAAALAARAADGPAAPTARGDVSGARAAQLVRTITALGSRVPGSEGERRAGALVAAHFERLGYRVAVQTFRLPNGGSSRNVVAMPSTPVRAVVVAHIDGVAGTVAANDNASGIGALVEVARQFSPEDGVVFAALGAEERIMTGSRLHLGSARLVRGFSAAGKRRIRIALSLDMVGVGPRLLVRGIEPAPNRSARIALGHGRARGLPVSYRQDSGQSDHAELTRAGIPAAWLQWHWDPCWHKACDEPARVSAAKVQAAAQVGVASLREALGSR